MWKASLLLAAVRADFDADLVAAGQRGQRRAHKAGPALLDVLRVPVRTGCALTFGAGNRTLAFRGARRIVDPRAGLPRRLAGLRRRRAADAPALLVG